MSWIKDLFDPKLRTWESFYRNRWQYDKVVRSTHGVNCTGGCSWNIFVKDGIVVWEAQALDYPEICSSIPPYEPRGCQRGISASWYQYSPIRIKYPLVRGALLDLFRKEKRRTGDVVEAWRNIQEDPQKRRMYQLARGKGGFRRVSWDEVLEIIAAANVYTVKTYGPDRLAGFSPIPAMSMISYAAGSRFLQLMGGVNLSFYDWYCDLPPSFPEMWGEQTDVAESADWYHAKFIAVMGSNIAMTRTPDAHFFAEARHNGTKTVVFSPDFSMISKFADNWIPIHAGQDGAFWLAVNHVILTRAHHQQKIEYFLDYVARFTDAPYLVQLEKTEKGYKPGHLLRANVVEKYQHIENGDWKFLNIDAQTGQLVCPSGSVGHRWDKQEANWTTRLVDSETQQSYYPLLTLLEHRDDILITEFDEYGLDKKYFRGVPVKYLDTVNGKVPVTTVYDLIMAQFGVNRNLPGDYPTGYDDKDSGYTPAWQEIFTGVDRATVLQFADEWIRTAQATQGRCMVIVGAGINHWYHGNLIYRAAQIALVLTGCVGRNGGGMNHYVGQEKLAPMDSWSLIMSARDWRNVPRLQQTPIWHYIHSDQWRYDTLSAQYNTAPINEFTTTHTADLIARAVRWGWMPFYPQFNKNTLQLAKEAQKNGANSNEEIISYVVQLLKDRKIQYCVNDPDNPVNFPRVWYIWRGNALMSSAKGHEFFLKHYLGTHHNALDDDIAGALVKEIVWRENAPEGKLDLVVDINFRMDTSALYADIVLPTATWYEKNDLNSTDLHTFIHPLTAAVPPSWESKSDWEIFKNIARITSELSRKHLPGTYKDIVNVPIQHDTPGEIAQKQIRDWYAGECDAIPGKTMHNMVIVERDYSKIYEKFVTLGEATKNGIGAHGNSFEVADLYEEMRQKGHVVMVDGQSYPSLEADTEVANTILHLSSLTNGELAARAYRNAEKRTGADLKDLYLSNTGFKVRFDDLKSQPRRYLNSPIWSGIMDKERTYAGFTYNVDKNIPWRTLTGRQQMYLDHEMYLKFGEHLPVYKPLPVPVNLGDLKKSGTDEPSVVLNLLTPHTKWGIHSTYTDNHRMLTLSRGIIGPCWISEQDAQAAGIQDNDWVEVFNDHGTYCTRVIVSARIPKGMCFIYHATERTISVPLSDTRSGRRAGGHNSLTRVRLKPNLLAGGYGQFTYHFNYWGPVGVNRDTYVIVKKMKKLMF
ncbi:MAG: nitrate reductase subunit alpha [Bacteroidales bacterium]|nr:nitrate reductase subunit alpha [Bacteroidales bacterium]